MYAYAFYKLLNGYRFLFVMSLCVILMIGSVVSLLYTVLEIFQEVPFFWIYTFFFIGQACYSVGHVIFGLKYMETSFQLNYLH